MRRIRSTVVATFCLVLAAAGFAHADEDGAEAELSARAERPYAINFSIGTGTEFGILSVERNWQLDTLSVDLGVGLGLAGFKLRVFPKLETRLSNHGWLTLGAGVNLGQHRWIEQGGFCFQDSCAEKRTAFGVSATTAVSLEYRGSSKWRFGPYIGAEVLLNDDAMECVGGEESVEHCEASHASDAQHRVFTGLRFSRTF